MADATEMATSCTCEEQTGWCQCCLSRLSDYTPQMPIVFNRTQAEPVIFVASEDVTNRTPLLYCERRHRGFGEREEAS
jgi:hypothetical protein